MSGDPVEEGGQAVRQGFVQALQTAHTTAALMRGRGGDARSKTEHLQRVRHADAKESRSWLEHRLRVAAAVATATQARELNTAKVDEVRTRIERGGEAHQMQQWATFRQIERADEDLARRNRTERRERTQHSEVHDKKIAAYTNREDREAALHDLDVEYKTLLIDIRRRAAGFTDTLREHGPTGEAMASSAAFAAAEAAADLSAEHADAATAYAERFTEDSGQDPGDIIDATGAASAGAAGGAAIEIVDAEVVEGFDDSPTPTAPRPTASVAIEDVAALAEELSITTHLAHEIGEPSAAPDAAADLGAVISDAVDATGITEAGVTEVMDLGGEAETTPISTGPTPSVGAER
ncbi:Uncharacterised protein [Nocardia farcinica]|nr:Uncharacterised protein [Nocardia farcinica]